jgi:HEAT repeat protein
MEKVFILAMKLSSLKIPLSLVLSSMSLNGCVVFLPLLESDYNSTRQDSCPLSGEISGYAQKQNRTTLNRSANRAQAESIAVASSTSNLQQKSTTVRARRTIRVHKQVGARVSKKARVDSLISQLKHEDDVVRTHAATDLGMMGSKAQRAVKPLYSVLERDESKWVRRAAVKALAKIGTPEVLAPLTFALSDSNKYVVHSAKRALKKLRLSRKVTSRVVPL